MSLGGVECCNKCLIVTSVGIPLLAQFSTVYYKTVVVIVVIISVDDPVLGSVGGISTSAHRRRHSIFSRGASYDGRDGYITCRCRRRLAEEDHGSSGPTETKTLRQGHSTLEKHSLGIGNERTSFWSPRAPNSHKARISCIFVFFILRRNGTKNKRLSSPHYRILLRRVSIQIR